jgi:hypothetical protein
LIELTPYLRRGHDVGLVTVGEELHRPPHHVLDPVESHLGGNQLPLRLSHLLRDPVLLPGHEFERYGVHVVGVHQLAALLVELDASLEGASLVPFLPIPVCRQLFLDQASILAAYSASN